MSTHQKTELTILNLLSKCTSKVTMHDLFEMIPEDESSQDSAIIFIQSLNQLHDYEFAVTSRCEEGAIYWHITEEGRQQLTSVK